MHKMQTFAINVPSVCRSVSHAASRNIAEQIKVLLGLKFIGTQKILYYTGDPISPTNLMQPNYCFWPWPDSNLAWWPTLARCGRSSDVQTWCHHAQMSAWQGSAVPCQLLHTGHWCCRQAAFQVGHTATDGGSTTSAIQSWTPSFRCAQPHGLELRPVRSPCTAGLWVL